MDLHDLGLKHGSDKASIHAFTYEYDKVLNDLRYTNLEFLEVGILQGASLKMWYEYFPNSVIHGVDLWDYSALNNERIKTHIANQEDEASLRALPKNLDIILDDGGHTMLQQQLTLKVLLPDHLKSGGLFILEDLHTSGPSYSYTHGSTPTNNTLKLLYDLKNGDFSKDNDYYITEDDFNVLKEKIEDIEIINLGEHHITSIIRKK